MQWSSDHVASIAPDAASLKAAQKLATAGKWQLLAQSEVALWGEVKGSGANPYLVGIDLNGPAFKCSCPSRKFPCKHALGLALIFAATPDALAQGNAPAWLDAWLQKRVEGAERQAERVAKAAAPVDAATQQKRAVAQAQRAVAREQKIQAGVAELQQWLKDIVRQGLAAQGDPTYRFWDEMAARMVDAQAPGLARRVRDLAALPQTGPDWHARLLERLGQLHLLLQAFERLDTLSPDQQADIRSLIGFTQSRDALLAQDGVRDAWWVVGKRLAVEDNLRVQYSWLWGSNTRRMALILDFAAAHQPLDPSLVAGLCVDAELVFYPSAWPIRALLKAQHGVLDHHHDTVVDGFDSVFTGIQSYAATLAQYPWVDLYPMRLKEVVPVVVDDRWVVHDAEHQELLLAPRFSEGWKLLALSGGQPLAVFGEWDGDGLLPLSVFADDGFTVLAAPSPTTA